MGCEVHLYNSILFNQLTRKYGYIDWGRPTREIDEPKNVLSTQYYTQYYIHYYTHYYSFSALSPATLDGTVSTATGESCQLVFRVRHFFEILSMTNAEKHQLRIRQTKQNNKLPFASFPNFLF